MQAPVEHLAGFSSLVQSELVFGTIAKLCWEFLANRRRSWTTGKFWLGLCANRGKMSEFCSKGEKIIGALRCG